MKRKLSFGRDSNGRTSSNGDGGVLRQDQTVDHIVSVGDISRTYSANQFRNLDDQNQNTYESARNSRAGNAADTALHATQTIKPRSNGFSTLANPDNKLVTLGSFAASSRMSDLHSETQETNKSVRAQGNI
jgi:hypothetical protein